MKTIGVEDVKEAMGIMSVVVDCYNQSCSTCHFNYTFEETNVHVCVYSMFKSALKKRLRLNEDFPIYVELDEYINCLPPKVMKDEIDDWDEEFCDRC